MKSPQPEFGQRFSPSQDITERDTLFSSFVFASVFPWQFFNTRIGCTLHRTWFGHVLTQKTFNWYRMESLNESPPARNIHLLKIGFSPEQLINYTNHKKQTEHCHFSWSQERMIVPPFYFMSLKILSLHFFFYRILSTPLHTH